VPTTRASRSISAPAADVWAVVGDPHHLPRWWPRVQRVEDVRDDAFTEVLATEKGRAVRADFRVVERVRPSLLRWEQEVQGTPFERILALAETEVRLEAENDGTRVSIALRQRMRGLARFGGFIVRRATRRTLDAALGNLEVIVGSRRP
jgi:uncharacterized protein YndB with AHSA1/START domain